MRILAIALVVSSLVTTAVAQQSCPCVPLTKSWVVTTCDTWNCAASALVLANGDPMTFTVSSGNTEHPWVIVRQIVSGSATVSENDPYLVEEFDGIGSAVARFAAFDSSYRPYLFSAPDGKTLVLSLRTPSAKKRAVPH